MTKTAEFFNVQPVDAALALLLQHWAPVVRTEALDSRAALGRVVAELPVSPVDLPAFRRSSVDGYAVRAADTFGASASLPAYLDLVASLAMGVTPTITLNVMQAAEIHTGGMLPEGADAVVMVERTQPLSADQIEVLSPVAPGENVIQVGEDVVTGAPILRVGQRVRPQDIGGLLGAGVLRVQAAARPRVGILSSGDELVLPEENPALGQIRDINAYTLAALVEEAGGEAHVAGIARDQLDDFLARARITFAQCDLLVVTAGSSVGTRDLTRQVIQALGEPGILQHGLAVKPGKPTLLAVCDNKPVIGLPGNPVSAFLVARQLIVPLIKRALGEMMPPKATVTARLSGSIASATGREDTVPVRLFERDGEVLAEPVFGKSNLIYTLVNADGLLLVPLNSGGLRAGTLVEVVLL
jgi:molybdopterin molybdotransferase